MDAPSGLELVEAFALDRVANGVGVDAQFTGDGADFPMLGVKVAANLRAGFRTDHCDGSPSLWNAWKWIDEASGRPQIRQRSHNQGRISCWPQPD